MLAALAAAGLGPLAPNGPLTPVDSPLGLALLAVGARPRQFGQPAIEESRSLPVSPTLTSQAIDTVATKESQQTVVGDASMSGLAAMSTSQTVPEVTSAALMTSAAPVTFTAQTGSSPAGVVVSRRRHPGVCGRHRQQHRVGDRHRHRRN